MSQFASDTACGRQARHVSKRLSARFACGALTATLAACAAYEQPAVIDNGDDAQVPDDSGGSSGSASVTGGNAPSPSAGMPSGGKPAALGGAGAGGAAGTAGGGSTSGGGGAGAGAGGTGGGGTGGSGGSAGSGGGAGACAECANLKKALVHRYDFEGSGAQVTDRVGTAHGSIQAGGMLATLNGKGVVNLAGGAAGAYVDLPNGLISSLSNATIETWVTWGGGDPWQRIFDFGDSTDADPEDHPASGKSYLFLTPQTDTNSGGMMRAVYSLDGGAADVETRAEASQAMSLALSQVVVVVDTATSKLLVYLNGAQAGEQAFSGSLASINDVNCWLGRSQYNADAELNGTLHDFRIYNAALTPAQIQASFAAGADPAFLAE